MEVFKEKTFKIWSVIALCFIVIGWAVYWLEPKDRALGATWAWTAVVLSLWLVSFLIQRLKTTDEKDGE